ncbi:nucleoside deaminase [Gulosibacter chungangensis]|uniref:tRNA-specific adenosine deaminase n=2 Tax=Gulosibacter chungangensis TaxID=979746 RepID=A0A7J5BIR4_9MICO|nr:nucleoside deaminase [Gulosibacter chungangensis]KAB1645329.1 nucleoside deaminase [Gulosibacter chungangensis]
MRIALTEALVAPQTGDIPIGALVVDATGRILGRGKNEREARQDPTAHAEIVAIRQACAAIGSSRLEGCTLVTTLEPCAMCAGAALTARVDRVVFGAWDEKAGAAGSRYDLLRDRRLPLSAEVIGGVLEAECAKPLTEFFRTG